MRFFSKMQFGFQEGVGCTILETTDHMLQRGSKIFSIFSRSDVRVKPKACELTQHFKPKQKLQDR